MEIAAIADICHRVGWVHGDIKPGNLLLNDAGVVVVDWEAAAPIGGAAPPGTLGYAPPWAWANGYNARPESDYYAIAITILELSSGKRVFDGERDVVLKAQRDFKFPTLRELTGAGRRAFAQIVRRAHGKAVARRRRPSVVIRADANRAVGAILRSEAISAFGGIGTVGRGGESRVRKMKVAARRGDLEAVLDAALVSTDAPEKATVVRATDAVRCASDLSPARGSGGHDSGIDQLRNERARIAGGVLQLIERNGPLVVLATEEERRKCGEVWWAGLESALAASGSGALEVVQLEAVLGNSTGIGRSEARRVLETIFASGVVGRRAIDLISGLRARSIGEMADLVIGLQEREILIQQGMEVTVAVARSSLPAAFAIKEVAPKRLRATGAPNARGRQESKEDPRVRAEREVARAEAACACGRQDRAIVYARRAQVCLRGRRIADGVVRVRLADVWMDLGRHDEARQLLEEITSDEIGPREAVRIGRIYAGRGEFGALEAVIARLHSLRLDADQLAERMRFESLAQVIRGDLIGASRHLRRALRRKSQLAPMTIVWLLNSLGNTLRLRNRGASARRVLRVAIDLATREECVRGEIAATGNLVLASRGATTITRLAEEGESLAVRCSRVGMLTDAATNALGASVAWLQAGEHDRALALVDKVLASVPRGVRLDPLIYEALLEIRLAALDLAERWREVSGLRVAFRRKRPKTMIEIHTSFIIWECCGARPSELLIPAHRLRASGARAIRVALRVASDERLRADRLLKALTVVSQEVDELSPIVGHLTRAVCGLSREHRIWCKILADVRRAEAAGRIVKPIALALHALTILGGNALDDESRQWFFNTGSDRDSDRPSGIRVWEWRMAWVIARGTESDAHSQDVDIEPVLTSMDEFVARLPRRMRQRYANALPTAVLLRSVYATERRTDAFGVHHGAMLSTNDVRVLLFRSGRSGSFYRRRASGLERVLTSALRLGTARSLDQLVGEIAAGLLDICRAERAVVIHETAVGGIRAKLATAGGVADVDAEAAELSRTALARVRETGRSELYDDAVGDVALLDRPSVLQFRPRSLLIVPLQAQGECAGLVYVENRSVAKLFSRSDLELVEGFAAQAALALENGRLVHELRQAFQDLDVARARAIRAASLRVIGQIASEVAHDFNNLLTTILGETQLLLAEQLPGFVGSALGTVERAAMDSAEVVKRIQDMARSGPKDEALAVSVLGLIDSVLELVRRRIERSRVTIAKHLAPGASVQGTEAELREVFTNILLNALDAIADGGLIRISVEPSGPLLAVVVEDTGLGMDEATITRIFEPFFTTKGVRGNGLGLSLASEIVRRHGGEISVSSRLRGGTRMAVCLPPSRPSTSVTQYPTASRLDHPVRNHTKPTVLIADCDAKVGDVVARMVERVGGSAKVTGSGREAVKAIEASVVPFDVVVADAMAPTVEGASVFRAAQERSLRTVLAVLGGSDEEIAFGGAVSLRRVRRLAKPVTLTSIVELLALAASGEFGFNEPEERSPIRIDASH